MGRAEFAGWRATAACGRTRGTRRQVSAAAIAALIGLALVGKPATAAELIRAADGAVVDMAGTSGTAPMLIRLAADDAVELFGRKLTTGPGAQIYVTRGNDYQKWALIAGTAALDGRTMNPGDVALVSLASGHVDRRRFDAARLAAAAPPGIAAELDEALRPLTARQRRQRFWGRLGPVGTSPSPAATAMEGIRRDYLSQDAVIDLRQGNVDSLAALPQRVADRFAAAVSAGDVATTASLLDPAPFVTGGAGWSTIRRAFAAAMIARLGGGSVVAQPATDTSGIVIRISGRPYALRFAPRDGFPFVSAMEAGR